MVPGSARKVSATADYMAERVGFELAVLLGEQRPNPNRATWQQR